MQLFRIILSTPKVFIISKATAVEALPDIGLINIKGNTSDGILHAVRTGDRMFWNKFKIPEFLSALTARNKATNVGNILITVCIPFFSTVLKNYQKLLPFPYIRKQL